MDISIFTKMLSDKFFTDLKKLKYKYPNDFDSFLKTLKDLYYKEIPIKAFDGTPIVYLENYAGVDIRSIKLLLRRQAEGYGVKAAEDEILSSSAIESIDFSRDSIRNILKGLAPKDEEENRILGQKRGLEFIADSSNGMNEENLFKLYMMTVGDFLNGDDRLPEGAYYRNDAVYIVSDRVEHSGIDYKLLPQYMRDLFDFARAEDGIDELLKAAIIHFQIAYLHPYFDGNGRMARMVHLWYLIQRGYQTALFVPFSSLIAKSRKEYYAAFTAAEENSKISGVMDVTPFLKYFAEMVYNKMPQAVIADDILAIYREAAEAGQITEKEASLWRFVLSNYGSGEFSTKQLERDFGDAAYATIRGFVLKFQDMGMLSSIAYGNRVKYRVKAE